jgi:hypothetical protein
MAAGRQRQQQLQADNIYYKNIGLNKKANTACIKESIDFKNNIKREITVRDTIEVNNNILRTNLTILVLILKLVLKLMQICEAFQSHKFCLESV